MCNQLSAFGKEKEDVLAQEEIEQGNGEENMVEQGKDRYGVYRHMGMLKRKSKR